MDIYAQRQLNFDYDYAWTVVSSFRRVAQALRERTVHSFAKCHSFQGLYADVFDSHIHTADADRRLLADEFETASELLGKVIHSAEAEDERRRVAREYIERHDDWYEKNKGFFRGR